MFEVKARLKIRAGELDGFERQAVEVMRQAREKDTKTLRYDWFISDEGVQCEVRESYVDADGLLEHNDHVKEARDKLFRDYAYDHDMTIYGEPSQALLDVFEAMRGHVAYHRFSLFQGLGDGEVGRDAFEATALLKIRDGELEGFRRQAAAIMRLIEQQDQKPLRYDWFLSDDGTECEVREAYVDADALLAQQRQIREAKTALFPFMAGHEMTFYSEPSPALLETMRALGATFAQFHFLQGLDTDIRVGDGVPV